MYVLDVLYWASFFLGVSYIVLTLLLGGVSHLVSSVHGAFDTGGDAASLHSGGGDVGHVDTGHLDLGHADAAHADIGHAEVGHGEVVHADTAHGDLGGAEAPHDAGQLAHTDMAGSEHAAGGHVAQHDHSAPHAHEPSHFSLWALLNPTMVSGFLLGFGGGGVVSRITGAGVLPSIACAGLGGGLMYGSARWLIVRVFGGAQASSHTRRMELVGCRGIVVAPMTASRPGMIALTLGGTRQTFRAVSDTDDLIPVGSCVRVRRVLHDRVIVSRVESVLHDTTRLSQTQGETRL